MNARTERYLVGAACLAGLLVRVFGLWRFELSHWDEGLLWSGARYFGSFGADGHYSPTQGPPLVPLLFGIVHACGGAPVAAAFVTALAGTASIFVASRVAREVAGPQAAVAAAALFALGSLEVLYARSTLTETYYVLFLLLALLASLRYLGRPTLARLWPVIALVCATQYTKYNGCLAGGPLVLVLAFQGLRGAEPRARCWGHAALLVGTVTVAMAVNLGAISVMADLGYFFEHYSRYTSSAHAAGPGDLAAVWGLVSPWSAALAGVVGLAVALRRRSAADALLLIALALYALFLSRYTFYLRLLAPVHALSLVFAALGLAAFARRRAAFVLALAACLAESAWRLPPVFQADYGGTREAREWVQENAEGAPVLLVCQVPLWSPLPEGWTHAGLPSEAARAACVQGGEVLVVADLHAHSKYGPRTARAILDELAPHRVARFENRLGLDVVENNLTVPELRRWLAGEVADLPSCVSEVQVLRVPADVLRAAVD